MRLSPSQVNILLFIKKEVTEIEIKRKHGPWYYRTLRALQRKELAKEIIRRNKKLWVAINH